MGKKLSVFWHWLTTTRHTAWLESEVERLRVECAEARRQNWALMNSLMGTAGATPAEEFRRRVAEYESRSGIGRSQQENQARSTAPTQVLRNPSWQQTARIREREDRKQYLKEHPPGAKAQAS